MKSVVIGCLCGVALAAVGCAGGSGTPTAPSPTGSLATAQTSGSVQQSKAGASGTLLLTKTCDAIDHCAVVTSTSGPFPVGSDINYSGPLLETRTTSKIVVTTPAGDTAQGHCSLSYRSFVGVCVITDGAGALAGLHANVRVTSDFSVDPNGVFTWQGDYHFVR